VLFLLSFIKSQQSLSAVAAVVGVLSGFLAGAYIPLGMFGNVVGDIFSALPFAQLTVLTRGVFLIMLEEVTPLTHDFVSGEIARGFGIELWLGDFQIPEPGIIALTTGFTLVLFICLIMRFSKMKKTD
jgi:multidrug/hemolysin transport system permease protein